MVPLHTRIPEVKIYEDLPGLHTLEKTLTFRYQISRGSTANRQPLTPFHILIPRVTT